MVNCKLVTCPTTVEGVTAFFNDEIGPLLSEYWDKETARTNVPHGLDVSAFLAAWEQKGIIVIMAYGDERKPVGFMIIYKFRPLFVAETVLNIERWYGTVDGAVESMFNYLESILPVMGVDRVHAATHRGQTLPIAVRTDDADSYQMNSLVWDE